MVFKGKNIVGSIKQAFVLNASINHEPVKEPKKERLALQATESRDSPLSTFRKLESEKEQQELKLQPEPEPESDPKPESKANPESEHNPTSAKVKKTLRRVLEAAQTEEVPPQYLSLDKLLSRRRSQIGPYAATIENTRCKNVPRGFFEFFLRNSLLDSPDIVYFIVRDSPPQLDPKLLHKSIEEFKSKKLDVNREIIDELQQQIKHKRSLISQYEDQQAAIEKMGAKLIRAKKRVGEPNNAKEKKERKDRIITIKKLKVELNNILSSIEEESLLLVQLETALKAPKISLQVMDLIKHTNEDGIIVQAASFASWVGDSPDLDFRYFLMNQWDGCIIPLKSSNKSVKLEYRPSSSHGILLAKFIFPYAEEGNWKRILCEHFLEAEDHVIESTKPLPISKKNTDKMPGLHDFFFVYTIFTLSLEVVPPKRCQGYPYFRLDIKSSLKDCGACGHVSHQTSRCPERKYRIIQENK